MESLFREELVTKNQYRKRMNDIIIDYLRAMKLNVSHAYIEKQLLSHPDYPSILSVSDTLEQLGLSVQVGRTEKEQLLNIPYPYLLHSKAHQSGFLLINNEKVLSNHLEKLKIGEGVVLKAEHKEEVSNPYYEESLQKETLQKWSKYIVLLSVGMLLLLSLLSNLSFENIIFLLTALAGLTLGYVLIAKDLGVKYAAVESFCGAGAANHCDKVLTSEYSKLFGTVSFSDAVLSYFAVQTIIAGFVLPFSEATTAWWTVLGGLAALSIPVILFSLYYQWAKIQAWCRLCLLVVGVLTLQIGFFSYAFLNGLFTPNSPGMVELGTTLSLFAGIGSVVIWMKELVKSKKSGLLHEVNANRTKYRSDVFTYLLHKGKQVDSNTLLKDMVIGPKEGPIEILAIINLHCQPCKIAYEELLKLHYMYPNILKIKIRLLNSGRNTLKNYSASTYVIRYWENHIYNKDIESSLTKQFFKDWYRYNDKDLFINKYQLTKINKSLSADIVYENTVYEWITRSTIIKTPTFFLNGFMLPDNYSLKDIPNLMNGFKESLNISANKNE